jgi:hypothetical protein
MDQVGQDTEQILNITILILKYKIQTTDIIIHYRFSINLIMILILSILAIAIHIQSVISALFCKKLKNMINL